MLESLAEDDIEQYFDEDFYSLLSICEPGDSQEMVRPKKRKLSASSSEEQKVALAPRQGRLRRLYDLENAETCAICFEDTTDCALDCCKHEYCFVCIQEWVTKAESRCP